MREIRPSGLEGGVARKRHPYPYRGAGILPAGTGEHRPTLNHAPARLGTRIAADWEVRAPGRLQQSQ